MKIVKRLKRGHDFVHQYEVQGKGKDLLVFSLRRGKLPWNADSSIDIKPDTYAYTLCRTELSARLKAGVCEYCGVTQGYCEVHHVRKLQDVTDGKTLWQQIRAAMRREKLGLCIECHDRRHRGQLPDWRWRSRIEVERRMR
jgi:5-methylcytosine-specific restriction endonuclease McrA